MENLLSKAEFDYNLFEKIGFGGEGEVYRGFNPQLNSIVAIKHIPIARFQRIEDFFEESKKLYLTRHHNIVEVSCAGKNEKFVCILMPYYANGSLKSLIEKRFLKVEEIVRYSIQFLSGLNNIHSKKLIHFDIKLENILISDSDQALISDFGLAQHTGDFGFAGLRGTTNLYAPPERFEQGEHNFKYDVYQAGFAIYRMCNGDKILSEQLEKAKKYKSTYSDENALAAIKKGDFPNRSFYFPHIPKSIRAIVRRAMNPDPNSRYDSIIQMLNDLCKIEYASDWQFIYNSDDNLVWEKENYRVQARKVNETWEVVTTKNNKRQSKYSNIKLSENDKNNLLYQVLNEQW